MVNRKQSEKMVVLRSVLACMLGFGLMFGVIGCDDNDDDRTIKVCNIDNEEYLVKLHRDSDGVVVNEFYLEDWNDSDSCDEFSDPSEGRYYLTIHENGGSAITDTSKDFYLDNNDFHLFLIDSSGSFGD